MRLEWKPLAIEDRERIMDYIAEDNPVAALTLDEAFEEKANGLLNNPRLYKPGRLKGTREIVVRPSYLMIYVIDGEIIGILRVKNAAQQWP